MLEWLLIYQRGGNCRKSAVLRRWELPQLGYCARRDAVVIVAKYLHD
jgi:hypothetical protein